MSVKCKEKVLGKGNISSKSLDGVIELEKVFRHKTLEERAAEFGGELGLDGEYNSREPIGREVW